MKGRVVSELILYSRLLLPVKLLENLLTNYNGFLVVLLVVRVVPLKKINGYGKYIHAERRQ